MKHEPNGQAKSVCWGRREGEWDKGKEGIYFSLETKVLSPCEYGVQQFVSTNGPTVFSLTYALTMGS